MAEVKSRGNRSTEIRLASMFRSHGISGWRRHYRLLGKPDFVFLKPRVAVFVDGCFWHGCPKHCRMPSSHREYWSEKIARNKARDAKISRSLRRSGWHVVRVWEHELQSDRVPRRLVSALGHPEARSRSR